MARRHPAARPTPTGDARSGPSLLSAPPLGDGVVIDITLSTGGGLGLLLQVADDVAARAGAQLGIEHVPWELTEVTGSSIAPTAAEMLTARANLLARFADTCVWQVGFAEPDGSVVAHAVLKRRLKPGDPPPLERDPRSEPELRPTPPPDRQRDHIARAAADVIAAKGFAQATVREIADAAGMHVPTLYTHIASKHDLLELVYTWAMDRILVDVGAASADCRTAREKVGAIVTAMVARADENKRLVGVLNRELRSLPQAARMRVLDRYGTILRALAKVIAEGVETGDFRAVDPAAAANIIDAVCDMRALRPFSFDQMTVADFDREIRAFVDAALQRR